MNRNSVFVFSFILCLCFIFIAGCCKNCPPVKLVPVYKSCVLPAPVNIDLPPLKKEGCPAGMACFAMDDLPRLTNTIYDMSMWIKQTRARCGDGAATSRPAE